MKPEDNVPEVGAPVPGAAAGKRVKLWQYAVAGAVVLVVLAAVFSR